MRSQRYERTADLGRGTRASFRLVGDVKRNQQLEDEKDTRAMLIAIHRGNPIRTATTIFRFLSNPSNKEVQDKVVELLAGEPSEEKRVKDLIVGGIRDSIKYHANGGARTYIHEMFVKFVVLACIFKIIVEGIKISNNCLSRVIGTTPAQIENARIKIGNMVATKSKISPPTRKKRKDYIRDRLKPHVRRFIKDDEYTRLDTNQGKVEAIRCW